MPYFFVVIPDTENRITGNREKWLNHLFIEQLAAGNIGQASIVIGRHSNLPAVCGRVCPHEKQCEAACVLNKKGCGIKIGKLERFVGDVAAELDISPVKKLNHSEGKIAVIGPVRQD